MLGGVMVHAQPAPPANNIQRVEPGFSDLSDNAANTRVQDPGLAQFPERGFMLGGSGIADQARQIGIENGRRFRIDLPGIQAYVNRSDYLVRDREGRPNINVAPGQDSQSVLFPGPGLVYNLVPLPDPGSAAPNPFPEGQDPRLDPRVNPVVPQPWSDDPITPATADDESGRRSQLPPPSTTPEAVDLIETLPDEVLALYGIEPTRHASPSPASGPAE